MVPSYSIGDSVCLHLEPQNCSFSNSKNSQKWCSSWNFVYSGIRQVASKVYSSTQRVSTATGIHPFTIKQTNGNKQTYHLCLQPTHMAYYETITLECCLHMCLKDFDCSRQFTSVLTKTNTPA